MLAFIILFFVVCYATNAQNFAIIGKVLDASTSKPIAGANVQISNSNRGTYTTGSGFFKLPNVSVGSRIIIQSLGYEQKAFEVTHWISDTVLIFLNPSPVQMGEVEKVGEIEVDEIIRRAINKKKENLFKFKTLQANLYSKLSVEFQSLGFEISGEEQNQGGTVIRARAKKTSKKDTIAQEFIKNFILETYSNLYVDYENKVKYSEITHRRQTANIPSALNTIVLNEFLNFYDETIKISNTEFVTPLSEKALSFYRFELLGKELYGDLFVYNIKVIPNTNLYPTFTGAIKILEQSYNLLEVDLQPSEKYAVNFVENLRFVEKFSNLEDKYWQPTYLETSGRLNATIVAGLIEVKTSFRGVSIVSEAIINQPLPDSIIVKAKQKTISVAPMADSSKVEFWASNSLVERSEKEEEIYRRIDSAAKKIKFDSLYQSLIQPESKFNWNISPSKEIGYNRVLGYTLAATAELELFPFKLSLTPIYSFNRKQFFYDVTLTNFATYLAKLISKKDFSLSFSLFSKPSSISLDKNMPMQMSNIFSYFFHWDYYDYYHKKGISFNCSWENKSNRPITEISLTYEVAKHFSLSKITDKSLFSSKSWRNNPEILENLFNVLDFQMKISSSTDVLGFKISETDFNYTFSTNLLMGAPSRGIPFGVLSAKLELDIPTFYTGFNPMLLKVQIEGGVATTETPPQYSFRMPNAWGFDNFLTAPTGKFGGKKYYALHLEHNFSDFLYRAVGLPKIRGRGLELSALFSCGMFFDYGNYSIYQATEKLFYEFGFALNRIPTFLSDLVYWRVSFKFNPEKKNTKGFGLSLNLHLPF